MSVLIEDSPRSFQAGWIAEAVQDGISTGAVLSPFATPWSSPGGPGRKPGVRARTRELQTNGVEVWFDPTSHALQMGGVGDFRYYDGYDLWGGPRGDLTTQAFRQEHVRKVFGIQDALGVQHLAPTILLHTGLSGTSANALELAREAIAQDPGCWLSVAGTPPFWASAGALDAHVGAVAGLEPAGWFLTVVRPVTTVPVEADPEEVHGLCRTVRAVSEDAPVHISHGDLAGLPAVAAGARSVGSGWDKRQRVCSYADYAARIPGPGGGGWYERATLEALVGSLSTNEAALLGTRDAALAARLGGLPPAPGPKEAFLHHVGALHRLVARLSSEADPERRYRDLLAMYARAAAEWPGVHAVTSCDMGADDWVRNPAAGLTRYGHTEGW
jgi:hypothetical protein